MDNQLRLHANERLLYMFPRAKILCRALHAAYIPEGRVGPVGAEAGLVKQKRTMDQDL
mgnify:CR=1 FL=1